MNKKFWIAFGLIVLFTLAGIACAQPKSADKPADAKTPPAPAMATPDTQTENAAIAKAFTDAKAGFDLFKDPMLSGSTNDKSCNTCHPYGGKDPSPTAVTMGTLIGKSATFPKIVPMVDKEKVITLVDMINFCLTHPMEATALTEDDPMMMELVAFHKKLMPLGYQDVALPIIDASCATCHTGTGPTSGLSLDDKDTAVANAVKIRAAIEAGTMPKIGKLTDEQFMNLIIWATNEIDKTIMK